MSAKTEAYIHLLESNCDAIIITDKDLNILYRSSTGEDITGWKADERLQMDMMAIIHPDDRLAFEDAINTVLKTPSSKSHLTHRVLHQDGHYLSVGLIINNLLKNPLIEGLVFSYQDISEQQQQYEQQDLLASIINSSDDAIISKKLDGTITSWNQAATRLFGYYKEEIIGKSIFTIIPPDLFYEEKIIIDKIKKGEVIDHFESRRIRKDGTILNVSFSISPIKDKGGKITGASKILRDITAEKKFQEQDAFFTSIINSSDDAIISKSLSGFILSWNKGAEKILGYTADEIIGKHISIIIPEQMRLKEAEIIERIKLGQTVTHYTTQRLTKQGKLVDVSLSISPIRMPDGIIIGASKILRDITENKRSEALLKASEVRLRNTLDTMLEGVLIVDFNWILVYVNDVLAGLCKIPSASLLGCSIMEVFPKIKQTPLFARLQRCMTEQLSDVFESEIKFSDQSVRFFELKVQPVPEGLCILSIDITDQKNATAQLFKSEKKLRALAENNYDLVTLLDANFGIIYRSPSATRITGWTNEEVLNEAKANRVHPDDKEKIATVLMTALDNPDQYQQLAFRNQHKDGHYLWLEGNIVNRLNDPDLNSIVLIFTDITERIQVEDKLRSSEIRFQSLLEHSNDVILLLDNQLKIRYRSPSAFKITGWTVDDVNDGEYINKIHPDDRNGVQEIFQELAAKPGIPLPSLLRYLHKNGHYIWLEGTITNLLDNPEINAILYNTRNVSDRILSDEKLQASEQRFRALVEKNENIIGVLNEHFETIYRTPSAERITGWKAAETNVIGNFGLSHPDDDVYMEEFRQRVLANPGKAIELITRTKHKNGHYIWIEGVVTNLLHDPSVRAIVTNLRDVTERIAADMNLIASEEHYRMLIDQSADGIFVTDSNGKYVDVNIAGCRMTGYARNEMLNMEFADLLLTMEKSRLPHGLETAVDSEYAYSEWLLQRKDGTVFIGEMSSRQMSDGKIQYILRDVTAKKENEIALQRSEKLYRSLFENMLHGFAYCQAIFEQNKLVDYRYLAVNTQFELHTGLADTVGRTINEVGPGLFESDPFFAEVVTKVIQTGKPDKFEVFVKPTKLWFSISLYSPEDGYFVSLVDNITERKTAEEKVRQSEMYYRSIIEQASEMIYITAPDLRYLDINPAGCQMLGYTREEFLQLQPVSVVDDSRDIESVVNEIKAGKTLVSERRFRKNDGTPIEVELSVKMLENGNFMVFARDTTERKKAEEILQKSLADLERSNRELEQFAYVASHDLQEPLRMVGSYMQLIEKRYKGQLDADADEFIYYAVDGANRMKQLIGDLLNYSRTNSAVNLVSLNMNDVLHEVKKNLKPVIEESGAIITSDELPVLNADKTQMVQLLQNLISNGIKFRIPDRTPVINIESSHRDGEWMFAVSDNGIGIEKQYSEKVFIIFKQLHSKAKYNGTGIGLAIAKKIVERHGGSIWFESVKGEGTTFYFTIN